MRMSGTLIRRGSKIDEPYQPTSRDQASDDDLILSGELLRTFLADVVPDEGITEEDLLKAMEEMEELLASAGIVRAWNEQWLKPKWNAGRGLCWVPGDKSPD